MSCNQKYKHGKGVEIRHFVDDFCAYDWSYFGKLLNLCAGGSQHSFSVENLFTSNARLTTISLDHILYKYVLTIHE